MEIDVKTVQHGQCFILVKISVKIYKILHQIFDSAAAGKVSPFRQIGNNGFGFHARFAAVN